MSLIKNQRGQIVSKVIMFIIIALVVFIGIVSLMNYGKSQDMTSSITDAVDTVSSGFSAIFGPLFSFALGLTSNNTNNPIIVLAFILVAVIVIGVLDAIHIFGTEGSTQEEIINAVIGIVISILGVRFMPDDIWLSLTAPSSALVATVLVGIPFLAIFSIAVKMKNSLVRKLLWLFYIVFLGYLMFVEPNRFVAVYGIFAILAVLLLFLDSTFIEYFRREKVKTQMAYAMSENAIVARNNVRKEIKELQDVVSGANGATPQEMRAARERIKHLREQAPFIED